MSEQDEEALPPSGGAALAPFWRRLLALAVDALILTTAGSLLGILDDRAFARLGPWGRLVGLLIAGGYFALFDGPTGGGRTPGQRLLRLRVVDADGDPPRWGASLARGFLLAPCFVGAGGGLFGRWDDPRVLWTALLTAGIGVSLYLTIFDRERRQGVHDLAAGTFVARSDVEWETPGPRDPKHGVVLAALLVVALTGGWLGWRAVAPVLRPLITVREAATAALGGRRVGARLETTSADGRVRRELVLSTMVYEYPGRRGIMETADRAATAALASGVSFDGIDALSVDVLTGYDIGLASFARAYRVSAPPARWRELLGGSAAPEAPSFSPLSRER